MPPRFIAPAACADRDKVQSVCSGGRTAGRLRVESEHIPLPDRHFLPVDRVRARAANDHVDFLLARIALVVDSPAEVGRQLEPVDPERLHAELAPQEPPITIVNFGTSAQATAVTSLAPSRAIPPASYSLPTMKPVMFCRKTSGIFRLQASSMKCAPFCADSAKRTPLFARIATGKPSIRAKPQTSVSP